MLTHLVEIVSAMHRFPLSPSVPEASADPTNVAADRRADIAEAIKVLLEQAIAQYVGRHRFLVTMDVDPDGIFANVSLTTTVRCEGRGDDVLTVARSFLDYANLLASTSGQPLPLPGLRRQPPATNH